MKLEELKDWSNIRSLLELKHNRNGFNANITEELGEKLVGHINNDEHEIVDAVCDVSVFSGNGIYTLGYEADEILGLGNIEDWLIETTYEATFTYELEIVYLQSQFLDAETDADRVEHIKNMMIVSFRELVNKGYNPDKCMDQAMKEINSRTGAYDDEAGKWKKFKTPEAQALWYTADFTDCRL